MELALLDIAGVTIVLLAEAGVGEPPPHATMPGRQLLQCCVTASVPNIGTIVETVVRRLWTLRAAHAGDAAAEAARIAALTLLLQRYSPSASSLNALRLERCNESGRCNARRAAIERVVDSVIAPALAAGGLDYSGLSIADARSIANDALAAVLDADAAITAAAPRIIAAVRAAPHAGTGDLADWQDDALSEIAARLAADLGLPSAMILGIVEAERTHAIGIDAIVRSLDERVVDAVETIDELRRLADRAGSDDQLEAGVLAIAGHVRGGTLAAADAEFAKLMPALEAAARVAPPNSSEVSRYAHALAARARVQRLGCEFREAASTFLRAARAWDAEDRIGRWRLRLAQARALAQLASLPGVRSSVIAEAVQIFAEAGGVVKQDDSPIEWAEATLELGLLLLRLGNIECKPERFLAAALHFKPAVEILTRERALDGWARGQVGLADALRGQGAFQGDAVTLAEAAFAYRAALGILTRGMTPELWHHARAGLAETLVRIAEETGSIESLHEALELLMAVHDDGLIEATGRGSAVASLALGRGMLLMSQLEPDDDSQGDDNGGILTEALGHIERALAAPVEHLNALERATAHRARGTIEAMLAVVDTGSTRLAAAADAKLRARDLLLALENEVEAEMVGREIEEIEAIMADLATPHAGASPAVAMTGNAVAV